MKIALIAGAAAFVAGTAAGIEWRDREAVAQLLEKDNAFAEYRLQAEQAAREALQQAEELRTTRADLVAVAAEAAALRNQEREVVERVITQEVIRYVSRPLSDRVFLPADWVRIHDAAATGADRGVPGPIIAEDRPGPDATTARASDSDALVVVTGNYATCHAIADQLQDLQAELVALGLTVAF